MKENNDGLFCGDGAYEPSLRAKLAAVNRILEARSLKDDVRYLVNLAWESGHDAGIVLERKKPQGPSTRDDSVSCDNCGERSATCYGAYEGHPSRPSCDVCCGHGNEDGWCHPIVRFAELPPGFFRFVKRPHILLQKVSHGCMVDADLELIGRGRPDAACFRDEDC